MSELETLRRQMREMAEVRRKAAARVSKESRALRDAQEKAASVRRTASGRDPDAIRNAEREIAAAGDRLHAARKARAGIEVDLTEQVDLLDPVRGLSSLSARTPIALLPVRMETRFQPGQPSGAGPKLLVRIYPDDCLVDTFHPNLSKDEKKAVRSFWVDYWAAGGVDDQRRAAWAGLVRSHGAGRAAWAVTRVRPASPAGEPVKADPGDVILVVQGAAPPAGEIAPVAAYWTSVVRAGRAASAEAAAFATLAAALGNARAEEVRATLAPGNLKVRKPPATAAVSLVYLEINEEADVAFWSRAARTEMLPDRFVLLGAPRGGPLKQLAIGDYIPAPLSLSPDPDAVEADWLDANGERLATPEDIAWMFDFKKAVSVGMGFEIDLLKHNAASGFDELIALGVRLDPDAKEGARDLEELLRRHRYGAAGLSIVPQGAPTNNTEGASSARGDPDDPAASYDHVFGSAARYDATSSPHGPPDGIALAACLGLRDHAFEGLIGAQGFDLAEAKAMNTALWPATFGHFFTEMMRPVLSDEIIARTRLFFRDHVSGRGGLPAIRINRQPYGVLPTTVFSRLGFASARGADAYRAGLHRVLERIADDWREFARRVKTLSSPGDPQQNLLDVLGLHPASVEHYVRLAQSWDHLFNEGRLGQYSSYIQSALLEAEKRGAVNDLLKSLGYAGEVSPTILERVFLADPPEQPRTPVIEPAPLSEERTLQAVTGDGLNYIAWLAANALSAPDNIRTESGFAEGKTPTALLYLYLRDAVLTAFADESDQRRVAAGVLESDLASEMKASQAFLHVAQNKPVSQSRFVSMYMRDPRVTGAADELIMDHVAKLLRRGELNTPLSDLATALETLKGLPTARLERLFCEHLDCCSYRLDAWRLGQVRERLASLRPSAPASDGGERPGGGLYLGAYGYLANVRPKPSRRTAFDVPEALKETFGPRPVETDSNNRGYILAPGLNHAVTAAILRGANQGAGGQELAIKLSSERVRMALFLQDGLRQGQSLGALLGYMFERGVHDAPGIGVAEGYLQELRAQFPLVANHMKETLEPVAGQAIESIAARNVVDGVRFIEHAQKTTLAYPYDLPLTASDSGVREIFNANLQALIDAQDALADLSVAESVHQALMSNIDRASGTLATFSEGKLPGETPDVVRSPRSGRTLTLRLALNLKSGLAPQPAAPARAVLDPALEAFLASQFPALNRISAIVLSKAPGAATESAHPVEASDLGISAIDLVRLAGAAAPDPALDALIVSHARRTHALSPLASVRIAYMAPAAHFRFAELAPLAGHWRKALFASRPLAATDLILPRDGEVEDVASRIDPQRVALVRAQIDSLKGKIAIEAAALGPLVEGLPATKNALATAIDGALERCEPLVLKAALFGCSGAEAEWIWTWKAAEWRKILKALDETRTRWRDNLEACDAALLAFDNPQPDATDETLFQLLQTAESAVSAAITLAPGTPTAYRGAIGVKRAQFVQRLQTLDALATPSSFKIADLVAVLEAAPALSQFDRGEAVNTDKLHDAIGAVAADVKAQCVRLAGELEGRIAAADAALAGIAAADLPFSTEALQTAGRALLGEDARVIPEFVLTPDAAAELALGLAAGAGPLLAHAKTQSLDPVEDWLHGLARVRTKVRAVEQAMLLGETIAGAETARLSPAQLPHIPGDHWLGSAPPAGHVIAQETLLYTAIFVAPFNPANPVCGLLIDEWTELIPSAEEVVGLTYHFDSPNSEPPQSWLLAVSPKTEGGWAWQDLVDTIRETVDMAKLRAVDPTLFDKEPHAHLLPATVLTVTRWPITISTMLNRFDLTVLADA